MVCHLNPWIHTSVLKADATCWPWHDLNSSEVINALSGLCAYLSLLIFKKTVVEMESHTTLFLLQLQFVGTALTNHGPPWQTPRRSPRLSWQETRYRIRPCSRIAGWAQSAAKRSKISLFATDSVSVDGGLLDLTSLTDCAETTMSSVAAIATKMDLDGFDIFQSQVSCLKKVEVSTKWNPIRIYPSTSKTVQHSFRYSHVGNWWGGSVEGN